MSGADILVKSLVDHGVEVLFAYPGGASMPLHQALTRFSDRLRTILPRHEQGGAFAAQGYARSTGKPGVCMATSGRGRQPGDRRLPMQLKHSAGGNHGAGRHAGDRDRCLSGDADR
jgi:hypothetical protein